MTEPCALFTAHLLDAGWRPLLPEPPGGLAMQCVVERLSLSLWLDPDAGLLRLLLRFPPDEARAGVFRDGAADLRMYGPPAVLLEVLTRITGAQRRILPDGLAALLERVLDVCPETYVIISPPGAGEALALVTGPLVAPMVH